MVEESSIELRVHEVLNKFGFKSLEEYNHKLATWIISRFMYLLGTSLMTDGEYTEYQHIYEKICEEADEQVREVLKVSVLEEYLGRVYDEDPIPYEYFTIFGLGEEQEKMIVDQYRAAKKLDSDSLNLEDDSDMIAIKIRDMIDEDPPKSIRPVESIAEAYAWFEKMKGIELCASLKIDGINLRLFYINGNLEYCCTRGRSGNAIDYTKVMSEIVPNYLEFNGVPFTGKVRGEGYTQPDKLEYLRNKYPADYVVPRTAAKTMLSVPHYPEDMKYLRYISFNNDISDKLYDKLDKFKDKGFDIVPKRIICWNGGTIEEFTDWISEILTEMHDVEISNNLKCDGMVVEVNNPDEFEKLRADSNYDEGNLALKLGPWEPEVYEATVKSLVMYREENKIQFNCKAYIEPVTISSGITLTTVNMFNLGLVQKYGIKPGDKIRFLFKNDNASQWVYEDAVLRLKTQIGGKQ